MGISILLLSLIAIFNLKPITVTAWGIIGHQSTAQIATNFLTTSAKSAVSKLLSGASLESVATWADDVRSEPKYKWSAPLHFLNTKDYACDYDYTRDCKTGMCITGAILNFTGQLAHMQRNKGNASTESQTEALKFITHFMGDIHQPLHTGFTSDRGGNSILITYFATKANLHAIWDVNIINDILENNYSKSQDKWVADLTKRVSPGGDWYIDAEGWKKCDKGSLECSSVWANEGIEYACTNSYECIPKGNEPCPTEAVKQGSKLAEVYYKQAAGIIDLRIAQGGVRLAAVLNSLFA